MTWCVCTQEAVVPEELADNEGWPWLSMAEGVQRIVRVQKQIMILVEEQNEITWKMQEAMAHRRKSANEGVDSHAEAQDPHQASKQHQVGVSFEHKRSKNSFKDIHGAESVVSETDSTGSVIAALEEGTADLSSIDFLSLGNNMTSTLNYGLSFKEVPSIKEAGMLKAAQARCYNIVHNYAFEPAMALLIVVNSICLGVAIDQELKNKDASFVIDVENLFLLIFIAELLLRIFVHGPKCLCDGWNMFDFFIVVAGMLSQWILDPLMKLIHNDSAVVQGAQQILVLRMLKLLRLVRAVRLVSTFKPLWKLTQGFLSSAGTMVSAAMILSLTLYVFACIGAEVISKVHWTSPEVADLVRERFSSLPLIMLSLVQFVTQDSISGIYFPLILERPALSVYFMALIVFVGLSLMNLLTAMLVETALSNATEDKEMEAFYHRQKEKQLRPVLAKFFQTLDKKGDNAVTAKEMIQDLGAGLEIPHALNGIVTEARIVELFEDMDQNGNGELSEDEFVNGMLMVAFSDVPVETKQMLHLLQQASSQMHKMEGHLHHISHVVDSQHISSWKPRRDAQAQLMESSREDGKWLVTR